MAIRKSRSGRTTPVLALRVPAMLALEIEREAKRRKISRSREIKRRLAFYDAAQLTPEPAAASSSYSTK